jgi:hypothetical protein
MSTDQERLSRRARCFVAAGAGFLVAWSVAATLGLGRGVGVAYQFYPPPASAGSRAGATGRRWPRSPPSRGLAVEVGGLALRSGVAVTAGRALVLVGSLLYAGLLWGLFAQRYG